jgi:hypothetical protein
LGNSLAQIGQLLYRAYGARRDRIGIERDLRGVPTSSG